MSWRRSTPVLEIDSLIHRHRAARVAAQIELEVAEHHVDAAVHDELVWRNRADLARQLIRDCDDEVDKLLEERGRHIPAQRPSDS